MCGERTTLVYIADPEREGDSPQRSSLHLSPNYISGLGHHCGTSEAVLVVVFVIESSKIELLVNECTAEKGEGRDEQRQRNRIIIVGRSRETMRFSRVLRKFRTFTAYYLLAW